MMLRETWAMRLFGLFQIPLVWWVRPSVVAVDASRCVIRIPLRRRNRNHVRGMYIGVLATGADLAAGYLAIRRVREKKLNVAPIFSDMRAQFVKKPFSDVLFTCEQGEAIAALLDGEGDSLEVAVTATCEGVTVATFQMTLMRRRSGRA